MYTQQQTVAQDTTEQQSVRRSEDPPAVEELLKRTGYSLEKTASSRQYGGPPPDYTGEAPSDESQVFIGRIPRDMKEDELVPVFEKIGKIYVMRIMMEKSTNISRGFAFMFYCNPEDADKAMVELNGYEIRPDHEIVVGRSAVAKRLYMGNILKTKTKEELSSEINKLFTGVSEVIAQMDTKDASKNRGYIFVDFMDHKSALAVRTQCITNNKKLYGQPLQNVDWADIADPQNEEELKTLRILHVSPLTNITTVKDLTDIFGKFGKIEVKKSKKYALIYFAQREDALNALEGVEKIIEGQEMKITFAHTQNRDKPKRFRVRTRSIRKYCNNNSTKCKDNNSTKYKNNNDTRDNSYAHYPDYDYYGNPNMAQGGFNQTNDISYDRFQSNRGEMWMNNKRRRKYPENDGNVGYPIPPPRPDDEQWTDPSLTSQVAGASGNWW